MKAQAVGDLAHKLAQLGMGAEGVFRGFLASARLGDRVALQIQEFIASSQAS